MHSFEDKSDQELYKIMKGRINSTYDQKIIAQSTLKKRNFDFNKVEEYKDKWELEKLNKEVTEEESTPIQLRVWDNPDFLLYFSYVMFAIVPIVSYDFIKNISASHDYFELENIISFLVIIINLAVSLGIYQYSKTRRKYVDQRNKKLLDKRKNNT